MDAKSFRQRILRPAEGVFLFHPRAIARLAGLERRVRATGSAALDHHLIRRGDFLRALEQENPEALSVIEGLPLPDWVLLLPMPSAAQLRGCPERTLLRDYWARRFEGELARQWQMARDDNQDQDRFGADGLIALIGEAALAEAREVLPREGLWLNGGDALALARAFAARVVRLRYFAPGSRGCFFPAVPDWATVDRWLEDGGLDLPLPLTASRLPRALERTRPSAVCGEPAVLLPLPADLPFDGADPDLESVRVATRAPEPEAWPPSETDDTRLVADSPGANEGTQADILSALRRGAGIRRRAGWLDQLLEGIGAMLLGFLSVTLSIWDRFSSPIGLGSARWGTGLQLVLLRSTSARAQQAEWDGRFATALARLARARVRYLRFVGTVGADDRVLRYLDQRRWAAAEAFADFLAVSWRLSHVASGDLVGLIRRLVGCDDDPPPGAQVLLSRLETVLLEGRASYYRLDPLGRLSHRRLRQVLPFQGPLKALAALDDARRQMRTLPWPQAQIDCFAAPLAALSARIGERLDDTLRPRLADVLHRSGLVEASPQGGLAAARLSDAMSGLIRQRWCLRFSDVRDLINQDQVSLPDLSWTELLRGDRLGRFDRAAASSLPGVYRRGELYVKGLQRLGAPVFGTVGGRWLLRLVLLPGLAALAVVELVRHLAPLFGGDIGQGEPPEWLVIGLLALGLSVVVNTAWGRGLISGLWRLILGLLRLIVVTIPAGLVHSRAIGRLMALPAARLLWEHLLGPVVLGALPLLPVALVWWIALPSGPGLAAWFTVLALAFVVGTLIRDTPQGRRGLDDLASAWQRIRERLGHERLLDLITPVIELFNGITRAFAAGLDRIRTSLSPRLGEPPRTTALKALAALPWAVCEWVVQLYAVVLIEPQVNPVKHFPAVTLGHKLMLPMLPALSGTLHTAMSAFLPGLVVVPMVAVTIALLPGLFGFLFWELKEDWLLYGTNRRHRVPPARIGHDGETLTRLLRRGFHSGTLPRAFDGLRGELARQVRDETPDLKALRRVLAPIVESAESLAHFAETELLAEVAAACPGARATMDSPRISALGVRLVLRLARRDLYEPVALRLDLAVIEGVSGCKVAIDAAATALDADCLRQIMPALDRFAERCEAASAVVEPAGDRTNVASP